MGEKEGKMVPRGGHRGEDLGVGGCRFVTKQGKTFAKRARDGFDDS